MIVENDNRGLRQRFSFRRVGELVVGKQLAPGILIDCLGIHFVHVPPKRLFASLKSSPTEFAKRFAAQPVTAFTPSSDAIKIFATIIRVVNRELPSAIGDEAIRILNEAAEMDRSTTEFAHWKQDCQFALADQQLTLKMELVKPNFLYRFAALFNRDISKESKRSRLWIRMLIESAPSSWVFRVERWIALLFTSLVIGAVPIAIILMAMMSNLPTHWAILLSLTGTACVCAAAIAFKRARARAG